jgi:rod shape-determining protein MreC
VSSPIFKKSVTNFYLLIFLVSISIISIVIDLKYPSTNYIRVIINDFIVNPIQYIVKTPTDYFYSFAEEKETINQLRLKIDKLEEDNKIMKINLQRINILENEVNRLRSIKSEMAKDIKNIKIAKITHRDVIPNKESIQVSIGSKDYIKIGQTVIGTNGVVGQVVEVNMYSSKVLLITDINSNVPAIITRTGKQIIVKGRSQDDFLEISFLKNDTDIKSGDLIITSGHAGRFIASLNVGRVIEIIRNEGERFATVIIEPSEYINNINEVIINSDEYKNK